MSRTRVSHKPSGSSRKSGTVTEARGSTAHRASRRASAAFVTRLNRAWVPATKALSQGLDRIGQALAPAKSLRLKKMLRRKERLLAALRRAPDELATEIARLEPRLDRKTRQQIGHSLETVRVYYARVGLLRQRNEQKQPVASIPVNNETVLREARQRGEAFKAKVLARPDMLSAEDAASRVNKTRQTINDQRLAGKLLGLNFGSERFRYPDWQFDDNVYGKPLESVLIALGDIDPWEKWRFFVTEDGMLEGKSPADVLRTRQIPIDRVVQAGKVFGGQ
jgi:hypothetical protein